MGEGLPGVDQAKSPRRDMRQTLHTAKGKLRWTGWELTRPPGRLAPFRLHPIGLPKLAGVRTVSHDHQCLVVPVEACSTAVGFSYSPGGWHPYVEALEAVASGEVTSYADSPLARLYQAFQPVTVQDAVLDDVRRPLPPLSEWSADVVTWIWSGRQDLPEIYKPPTSEGDGDPGGFTNLYFGPRPAAFVEVRFEQLVSVYESIATHGYRPDAARFIEGYFIVGGADYRFMVVDGQHRLAALAALGVTEVPVRLWGGPAVVSRDTLQWWTTDRHGNLPPDVAIALFERMLTEDGSGKARRLGLLRH